MSSVPVSLESFGCALNHIARAPGPRRSWVRFWKIRPTWRVGGSPLSRSLAQTHTPAHQLDTPLSPNPPGESRRRRLQTSETSPPVQTARVQPSSENGVPAPSAVPSARSVPKRPEVVRLGHGQELTVVVRLLITLSDLSSRSSSFH